MPSDRTIRRQLTNQSSYYERTRLGQDDDSVGRHAKESSLIGAGGKYTEARPPWNDPVVTALNRASDPFGVDLMAAPVVGAPHEGVAAVDPNADLASLSAADLRAELARLTSPSGPIVQSSKWDHSVQALENRRIAIEAELRRRDPRAKLAEVLARMDDRALEHEVAKASYEVKMSSVDDTDRLVDLEARIAACRWEQSRRRKS